MQLSGAGSSNVSSPFYFPTADHEGGGGGAGEEADADADAAAAMRGGHNETTAGMHDALQEIHEFGEEVGLSEDILLNQ